jgi:hypothetical protein
MRERVLYRIILLSVLLVVPLFIWVAPMFAGALFGFFVSLSPLWLPVVLALVLLPTWLLYVKSQYVASVPHTVLELKPGENTPRTARAMEMVFYSLYYRNEVTRFAELSVGQVRLPWSFEIVAHNGTVRFFMRIPTAHRAAIESRIRSEYRDIDIDEAQDYARVIPYSPLSMRLESREFQFTKPDPYPIATYEMYESDKKAEDPMLRLLGRMTGIGEHEHLLVSFMVRPHQRERKNIWEEPVDTLHSDAQREIQTIVGAGGSLRELPEGKRELVDVIEAGLKKPSFDCGIRAVYVAHRKEVQSANVDILDSLFLDFETPNRNGFTAYDARNTLKWPMSDVAASVPGFADWYMFDLYRRRAFFAPPYVGKPFILNTAELATLFHLPYVTRASGLAHSRGTRLDPPENLPVVA